MSLINVIVLAQKLPITLDSNSHRIMLEGKTISFTPISKHHGQGPEWSRMTIDDGFRIIGMREVHFLFGFFAGHGSLKNSWTTGFERRFVHD